MDVLDVLSLPTEIVEQISDFLTVSNYNTLSLTNKEWNHICFSNERFWKNAFSKTNNHTKSNSQSWREAYVQYFFYMNLIEEKRSKLENLLEEPCSLSSYGTDPLESDLIFNTQPKISIDLNSSKDCYLKAERLFCTSFDPKKSMFRYEKFMELKNKYPDTLLIPTHDIEMVWISHMLRPSKYDKDCHKIFKKLIPHKLCLNNYEISMKLDSIKETKKLWEKEFNFEYYQKIVDTKKYEEFFRLSRYQTTIVDSRDSTTFEVCTGIDKFKIDPNFKCQFSITEEEFTNDWKIERIRPPFITDSCYYAFWDVLMKNKDHIQEYFPDEKADVLWHAHMLHPVEYKKDCLNSFGFVLDHLPNQHKYTVAVTKNNIGDFFVDIEEK
eukprot:gene6668-10832_t